MASKKKKKRKVVRFDALTGRVEGAKQAACHLNVLIGDDDTVVKDLVSLLKWGIESQKGAPM